MMKCNWSWETLLKKGSITIEESQSHRKECKICREIDRRTLKNVDYSYPLSIGWKEPKCPFCFSEIPKPGIFGSEGVKKGDEYVVASGYKTEKCPGCGALYSYDPFSGDSETIREAAAELVETQNLASLHDIDVYIYHNYNHRAHAFNDYLSPIHNIIEDNGLSHLWFVRKRKEGEEPLRQPLSEGAMRHVIGEVVEMLEKTRSAFKSRLIAEAREKLERLL